MTSRRRLDQELVHRRLAASRTEAHELIDDGRVLVGGAAATKASRLVAAHEPVVVTGERARFVSRGGDKLDAALDEFSIDVAGMRVLDAGASTGGFTDCLLQRGAARVMAVDVGHGQLHPRIRADERVDVRERLNVRTLTPQILGGAVPLCVADLSFISLRVVCDVLLACVEPGGSIVWLVKPQFEAGHIEVSRGRGVITDPAVHQRVCDDVTVALKEAGASVAGWMTSPLKGGSGNIEFLVHARVPAAGTVPAVGTTT
jgi:23S rRNA (cytidine1920-2'-O)/16S rRNA (cytidine1409-2'-O)-methyltransferase